MIWNVLNLMHWLCAWSGWDNSSRSGWDNSSRSQLDPAWFRVCIGFRWCWFRFWQPYKLKRRGKASLLHEKVTYFSRFALKPDIPSWYALYMTLLILACVIIFISWKCDGSCINQHYKFLSNLNKCTLHLLASRCCLHHVKALIECKFLLIMCYPC